MSRTLTRTLTYFTVINFSCKIYSKTPTKNTLKFQPHTRLIADSSPHLGCQDCATSQSRHLRCTVRIRSTVLRRSIPHHAALLPGCLRSILSLVQIDSHGHGLACRPPISKLCGVAWVLIQLSRRPEAGADRQAGEWRSCSSICSNRAATLCFLYALISQNFREEYLGHTGENVGAIGGPGPRTCRETLFE